jgi:hypothetical protein
MRHIDQLLPLINVKHTWVMFCDDDDTYDSNRVLAILQTIVNCQEQIKQYPDKTLAGVYESTFGKTHQEQRHEFWCYCVHSSILTRFYNIIRKYPAILDHKCCDVLFGEYLRRLSPEKYLFGTITDKYYNYRVDNNSDSITGEIKQKMTKIRTPKYMITDTNRIECAKDLNEYLKTELHFYIHDTYLRTIIGTSFTDILRSEFKTEYEILELIDQKYIRELRDYYEQLRIVANQVYDVPI